MGCKTRFHTISNDGDISMGIAIVAVGYNRPDSIEQLLQSLLCADYAGDRVDLVVSLDKGQRQQEIKSVAEKINWPHGEKTIRTFPDRQGLRAHIIQCGDLTEKYDAVVVLEDDLIVASHFYSYVRQAVSRYSEDDNIAGISLYKHQTHPGVNRPFEPVNNGFDIYMQQFAMSWGQCWTRKMWQSFRAWYNDNIDKDLAEGNILPAYISHWNKQSWLKYYMRYIVEKDKYFIYPYFSLTTNASDAGEHCRIPNNDFQVSLQEGDLQYRFPSFEQAVKYDVFFERVGIEDKVFSGLKGKKLLDLYGNRTNYGDARYLISTKALPYRVVRKAQLRYRPVEINAIMPSDGEGIYVYDLRESATKPKINKDILSRYDVRSLHWKKTLHLGWNGFIDALLNKIRIGKK